MNRRLLAPALVLALALASLLTAGTGEAPDRADLPAPGPGSARARALLGGLAVGDPFAGFEVEGLAGPGEDGALYLHLIRSPTASGAPPTKIVLSAVPRGLLPHNPPAQTDRYDLYFGHVRPENPEDLDGDAIREALEALAARLRAHEPRAAP
ncbi:MAG: hypothetical protein IPK80_17010 [Nannocystis sp.]|nr:hypothetical protein [Nannocystis sp.]